MATVCDGKVVRSAPVSPEGVEAGDARLGTDGTSTYVVWQEVPQHREAELRLAKVICDGGRASP
jgi:hypothetical protein